MRLPALLRERTFARFLIGQSISFLGSEVTHLALPLTAVLILQATPAQMGMLGAARNAPFLVFGLLAGVWVDRMRRRSILIAADLGRAALLLSIPAAALLERLAIEQLYLVAFLTGTLSIIAVVAYQAFLPTLVRRDRLVEANSTMETSSSVTQIAGPGLGGLLVQWLTAPVAIVVDAISYVMSAAFLGALKVEEPPPQPRHARQRIWTEVGEGLRVVVFNPYLRSIMLCGTTHNLFSNGMAVSLYVLYVTRGLQITPALLGAIFAFGGPGALLGALLAGRVARRVGLGRTLIAAQILTGLARLCIPLAGVMPAIAVPLLAAGEFLLGVARPLFNINQLSLRQAITPDQLQGRMNASIRFLMWAIVPVGSLLGGLLGQWIGLWPTLVAATAGTTIASLWLVFSPVRPLRVQPAQAFEPATSS